MLRNAWVMASTVFAVALVMTGCGDECTSNSDCASRGDGLVCEAGKCVEEEPTPPGADAGQDETDAGETDAGEMNEMDAGTDAGMNTSECSATVPCEGAFNCELDTAGNGVCAPLLIGVSTEIAGGLESAVLFPFNDVETASRVELNATGSRLPRFSADGTQVAFVRLVPTEAILISDLDGANATTAITATQAGTGGFTQLEYAPGEGLVWTRAAMGNVGGIQTVVPGSGDMVTNVTTTGTWPDWSPIVPAFAFANAGINAYVVPSGATPRLTSDATDTLPRVSPDGSWFVFVRSADPAMAAFSQELWLTTPQQMGFMELRLTTHEPAVGDIAAGGSPGSFTSFPEWAGGPDRLVFVKHYYYLDAAGVAALCDPGTCGGAPGQVIAFQHIDPMTGALDGPLIETPAEGTLPTVSPDGAWLSYVSPIPGGTGSRVRVTNFTLDKTAGTITPGDSFAHDFTTQIPMMSREYAPRWQPKQQ